MDYVYAALWFLAGLIDLFRFGKENKIFYLLGGFFLLLGAWWLANALMGGVLFAGVWNCVMRGVTAVVLVLACVAYYKEIKKSKEENEKKGSGS